MGTPKKMLWFHQQEMGSCSPAAKHGTYEQVHSGMEKWPIICPALYLWTEGCRSEWQACLTRPKKHLLQGSPQLRSWWWYVCNAIGVLYPVHQILTLILERIPFSLLRFWVKIPKPELRRRRWTCQMWSSGWNGPETWILGCFMKSQIGWD